MEPSIYRKGYPRRTRESFVGVLEGVETLEVRFCVNDGAA